jgi:hypothetical protein
MDPGLQEQHSADVIGAYKAAVRLRLYARISGMASIAAVFGVFVGGVGIEEGVTWIVLSLLLTVVPAASLYAASSRTSLGAARLELTLDDS